MNNTKKFLVTCRKLFQSDIDQLQEMESPIFIYWITLLHHAYWRQLRNGVLLFFVVPLVFCRSLFVLLSFFFWPWCWLSFDLQLLITPLVFSNSWMFCITSTVVLYVSPRHPLYTDVKTLILNYFKLKKWNDFQ
jgi:hypothetical protein